MKHTINDREGWLKLLNWMTNDYQVLTAQNGFYEISKTLKKGDQIPVLSTIDKTEMAANILHVIFEKE